MNLAAQIATQLRQVYFGGNWTSSNLKDQLAGITWEQATTEVYSFNTIATLVYHTNYYVGIVIKVLQGQPLVGKDEVSFIHPPIASEEDWEKLKDRSWRDAENFAAMIEQMPESKFDEIFSNEKYGTYYRNIHGIIEHIHYHLVQIVLIKKIISQPE